MSPQQAALRSLRLVIPPHRAEHQSERDRRVHHRCTLAELPWLREVRLKYGPRAVLIDLSGGGAQLETAGYRLNPGSIVVVEINGNQDESPIPSRVIRCQIAGLAPQPIYRSALQFKRILALPASAAGHHSLGADANPAREHARLLHALRRLDAARSCWGANASPMVGFVGAAAEVEAMSGVLAMIETPAARRAGPAFTREVAALFNIVARAIEKDTPEDVTVACLVDRLRRTVPVRAIRVTESLPASGGDRSDEPRDRPVRSAESDLLRTRFRWRRELPVRQAFEGEGVRSQSGRHISGRRRIGRRHAELSDGGARILRPPARRPDQQHARVRPDAVHSSRQVSGD